MSEFFLELFSEETPSSLQKNLRQDLLYNFEKLFTEKFISFRKSASYSTPNRAIVHFEGLKKQVVLKSEEIKGPNIKAPEIALEGYVMAAIPGPISIRLSSICGLIADTIWPIICWSTRKFCPKRLRAWWLTLTGLSPWPFVWQL